MPHSAPINLTRPFSRRRFIAVTAGATALSASVGGCSTPSSLGGPDPLQEIADAAHRDAVQFAAADASHGDRVQILHKLAEVRRVHAERLLQMREQPSPDVTPSAPGAEQAPPVCPPLDEVRSRLRGDASRATEVAVADEGPRAALTASVAAACVAAVEVVLA